MQNFNGTLRAKYAIHQGLAMPDLDTQENNNISQISIPDTRNVPYQRTKYFIMVNELVQPTCININKSKSISTPLIVYFTTHMRVCTSKPILWY